MSTGMKFLISDTVFLNHLIYTRQWQRQENINTEEAIAKYISVVVPVDLSIDSGSSRWQVIKAFTEIHPGVRKYFTMVHFKAS